MNLLFIDYILIIAMIIAIYFDLTQKRIPNKLTFPVILLGFLAYTIESGFRGLAFSLLGFFIGMLIFLIPFAMGGMGAGDVKLMAAIGALKGWRFAVATGIYSALAGGVYVLIYLLYKRRLAKTLLRLFAFLLRPIIFAISISFKFKWVKNIQEYFINIEIEKEEHYIPYGLAIGVGAMGVLFNIWSDFLSIILK